MGYLKQISPFLLFLIFCSAVLILTGCIDSRMGEPVSSEIPESAEYVQITPEEAKKLMETASDYLIVDVRRADEYAAGHIPGAICVPNEEIQDGNVDGLPDTDQLLLIYCRSGRRSKLAAQKLVELGYTRVYEFGGILDWPGEIVTEERSD